MTAPAETRYKLHPELLTLAEEGVGRLNGAIDRSWEHGESAVWEVHGERGTAFLKFHRQARKYEQELRAYREWLPRIAPETPESAGVRTPRLLALRDSHPRALLLEAIAGTPLAGQELPVDREREAHRRAGAFLAMLHRLPNEDDDPMGLAEAFARRCAAWTRRAEGRLPAATIAGVRDRAAEALPALRRLRRVPCHRDYSPRNWLTAAGGGGELGVIDFEHARADLWPVDMERLWRDTWPGRPDLRETFLEGYGRELDEESERLLERWGALGALATVVWAQDHGDRLFEAAGRAALERLGLLG